MAESPVKNMKLLIAVVTRGGNMDAIGSITGYWVTAILPGSRECHQQKWFTVSR